MKIVNKSHKFVDIFVLFVCQLHVLEISIDTFWCVTFCYYIFEYHFVGIKSVWWKFWDSYLPRAAVWDQIVACFCNDICQIEIDILSFLWDPTFIKV